MAQRAKSSAVGLPSSQPAELSYGQGEKSLIQKLVQKCTFNGNLQPGVASATATGVFPVRKPRNKRHKVARSGGKRGKWDEKEERAAQKSVNGLFVRQMAAKDEAGMLSCSCVCLWPWSCATGNGNCVAQPSALQWWCKKAASHNVDTITPRLHHPNHWQCGTGAAQAAINAFCIFKVLRCGRGKCQGCGCWEMERKLYLRMKWISLCSLEG